MPQQGVKPTHSTEYGGVARGALSVFSLLLFLMLACPLVSWAETESKPADEPKGSSEAQVRVTYYYTNYRCPTCRKLETYSRQAVEEGFSSDIEAKRVVFLTRNLDEPENNRYVEEYKLVTKSLILSLHRNGREVKWKNLPDIWKLVGDQDKFKEYVQRETSGFLEER